MTVSHTTRNFPQSKLSTFLIIPSPHVQTHSAAPILFSDPKISPFLGSTEIKFHTHNTTGKFIVSRILFCAPCGRRRRKKKKIRNRKGDNILRISTAVNFFVNVISTLLLPFPYIWALAEFERTSWLVWFVLISGHWAWTTVRSFGAGAGRWIFWHVSGKIHFMLFVFLFWLRLLSLLNSK